MTLTALVGALVALVARPKEPQRTKDQEEIELLKRWHARLIDRIETLELENEGLSRELAAERNLSTHWIGEASRFAREARQQRERLDSFYAHQQYQQAAACQLQAQGQLQQNALHGHFCNCVPSRGQVFGIVAEASLVEQFNDSTR